MKIEETRTSPEAVSNEAERLLLEHPEPMHQLFSACPTALLLHHEGIVQFANQSAALLFGSPSPTPLIGMKVLDLVHPNHRDHVRERIQRSLSTGQTAETVEETLLRFDGSEVIAEVTAFPVRFGSGTAMFVMARDVSSRVAAENALKFSEERFRQLVSEVQVGVLVTDAETQILLNNPAAQELLGLEHDEILQRTCFDPNWDVIDENGNRMEHRNFPIPIAVQTRKPVRGVVMGVARPGLRERIWLLVDANPVAGPTGDVERVVCTFTDITDRKLSEFALHESEARFRMVVEGLGEGLLISDLNDSVLFANQRLLEITGFDLDDIKGQNASQLLGMGQGTASRAESPVETYESQVSTKSGRPIWVQVCSTPFRSAVGDIVGTISAITDITEKRLVQEEARRSEERLQLALETSNDGLWDWDVPSDKIFLSPGVGRILGFKNEESVASRARLRAYLHPDDRAGAAHQMDEHLKGATGRFDIEMRVRTASGEYRWVRSKGKLVERTPEGSPLRVIGTLSDIDSILRSQEELREARDLLEIRVHERTEALSAANETLKDEVRERQTAEAQLKATNAELEAFAHSISHDLKAPLRAISGFASALAEDCTSEIGPVGTEHVKVITDSVQRMDTMLDDLLTLARLGKQDTAAEKVNLNEVFEASTFNLSAQIRESNAEVSAELPLPTIKGYRTALLQLFQNLISNAVKFSAAGRNPIVHVAAAREGQNWHLTFADNGIGIEPSYAGKIFELFERLNPRERYPGTGIGLAIVKKAVLLHRGEIWVESSLGQGSVFHVRIPA